MKEIKVSIDELVSISSYSIEKGIVPAYEQLEQEFHDVWADVYLDESLKDDEGKPCFIIRDNADCGSIRGIYVGDELTDDIKAKLIENLDNVIFDLIYDDCVIESLKDESVIKRFLIQQNYEELLQYLLDNKIEATDYDYSWLLVLGKNRLDLVEI